MLVCELLLDQLPLTFMLWFDLLSQRKSHPQWMTSTSTETSSTKCRSNAATNVTHPYSNCRLTKCPKRPVKLCYLNIKPWFLLNIDQAFFGNEIPMSTPPPPQKKKSLRSWQICQELTWTRLINWTCFFAQETDKKIEDNQKEKHKRKYLR